MPTNAETPPSAAPHALELDALAARLDVARPASGLATAEAEARYTRWGPNRLPHARPPTLPQIFLRQFASPLIAILVVAAIVSVALDELTDALFIGLVLLVNAVIGTIQEYGAERSAEALSAMLNDRARARRDGQIQVVDADRLVPGDLVLLEPGDKVPADLRLISANGLLVDESMLTGESVAVHKDEGGALPEKAGLGDRPTMAFAGTLVARGHAQGIVVATGANTELGQIAELVVGAARSKPPLIVRMELFTKKVAGIVIVSAIALGALEYARGATMHDVFFTAVALAVCAIPEGLPIAMTVALSLGARRMAARRVIARRLVSVEALGSCTFIASDKTGTLTRNELVATHVAIVGDLDARPVEPAEPDPPSLAICEAVAASNDAALVERDGVVTGNGDAVDVALLLLARAHGVHRDALLERLPPVAALPFEAENQFSASAHQGPDGLRVFVKGAPERVLRMCERQATRDGHAPYDAEAAEATAQRLTRAGFRVLAVAAGPLDPGAVRGEALDPALQGLTALGFVCMIDPLRPEAQQAVADCRRAGIDVAMVTGDHPNTALAIARELGIAERDEQVVTGPQLRVAAARGEAALDARVRGVPVFARVEPDQKLEIVQSLQRAGHFVAVTGDGANDAPALRAAEIGVAMGARGTDVARETAGLILTDDNFASIVAGVEEGRVAYMNVRKVTFLLISSGAAEILLFVLSLAAGLPIPLLPVQLLWLNLVTNGIQDVALAFEPKEVDVLARPPRRPNEAIIDGLMLRRVLVTATVMAVVSFTWFKLLLDAGATVEAARNEVLLLMVLFENIQAGNSRSETRSVFAHNPLRNKVLLIGTLAAQLIHIGAMHAPGLSTLLGASTVSFRDWAICLGLALTLLVASEVEKAARRRRP